ncbi:MAG: FkbM family methyltransferase [Ramlibacter sp.]
MEHEPVLRRMGSLRTVIDVGANKGQFALAARGVLPDARLISFEPMAAACATYEKVLGQDRLARLVRAGIGEAEETLEINVSARDDSSSLLAIGNGQVEIYPGTHKVGSERVRVARLSQLVDEDIEAPALLKIDVQGYELHVLKGCEEALPLCRFVYVECSYVELYEHQPLAGEVAGWLMERGYEPRGLFNATYRNGCLVQADHLFERSWPDGVAQPGPLADARGRAALAPEEPRNVA